PVYILDESNAGKWRMGAASRWWLHQSLIELNQSLDNRLQVYQGDPLQLIPALCSEHGATEAYWNRCYEPWRIQRDKKLKARLQESGVEALSHNGSLLWEPWQVAKKDGTPYKVFTPYFNKGCLAAIPPRQPIGEPKAINLAESSQSDASIRELELLPRNNWYETIAREWQPGAKGAAKRLQQFLADGLQQYRKGRDFPALQAVSRLSPHLHFGEISPNQAWYQAQQEFQSRGLEINGEHFQRELGWREFSYYLLYHFPTLTKENFQPKFDQFPWQDDETLFEKWCRGQTGYPIVDAGMRELWQTGYMHNRVRMIVASFLIKNLLIDWRRGADWFWDCLVDADLASNSASWQWVAGSGADAAPYFRIFNPVTQGKKFDPEGEYVRRFVPEISSLPDKQLHDPSSAPPAILEEAGVVLGKNYPEAAVDLKASRARALEAFKTLKR
ncbi:MAG: DNA photolyase family protein, partial [Gammaproteobacteria bacterium]|nr:DNA photolyase family protein [Gammaproteobacteria bacterium]